MDADGWLQSATLTLSIGLYSLLCIREGYLSKEIKANSTAQSSHSSLGIRLLLGNNDLNGVMKLVLITLALWAWISLSYGFTHHKWFLVLTIAGFLVLMLLVNSISVAIGIHSKLRLPHILPIVNWLLWPMSVITFPLWKLQNFVNTRWSDIENNQSNPSDPSDLVVYEIGDDKIQGDLEPHERKMISSILKLDQTTAREIMVHRMDILALEASSSLAVVAEMMWDSGHSRIPLYEESLDKIIGVVHSRDMLQYLTTQDLEAESTQIVRPPLFIPASKRLDDLLKDFQENHIQIAIVVDEYGGTAGLVTVEDLLEEIVGEIEDEFDIVESIRENISSNEALIDARIPLEEINRIFNVSLEGEGFDTLGGLLYQQLGRIPVQGDEVQVDMLTIRVLSTTGRRVKTVRVTRSIE